MILTTVPPHVRVPRKIYAQGKLVPLRIPQLRQLVEHVHVEVGNQSQAMYASDSTARRWVWKREMRREGVLAEALGWLLSRALDVPTPDAAFLYRERRPTWASAVVQPVLHWRGEYAQCLAAPDGLGAMLALDAIIGNPDRHTGNILCSPSPDEAHLDLYSIDLASAYIGDPLEFVKLNLAIVPPEVQAPPRMPVDMVEAPAFRTATLARELLESDVRSYVVEACNLVGEQNVNMLCEALLTRLQAAEAIVDEYVKLVKLVHS